MFYFYLKGQRHVRFNAKGSLFRFLCSSKKPFQTYRTPVNMHRGYGIKNTAAHVDPRALLYEDLYLYLFEAVGRAAQTRSFNAMEVTIFGLLGNACVLVVSEHCHACFVFYSS